MDLKLERPRLAFNTMNGKEYVPTRFRGELPVNPYLGFPDSDEKIKFGPEYAGYMAELIHMQKEEL